MSREVIAIVARADNGVIGKDGRLPWHIPADLMRFKQLTMGTPMIMGRKTFESLGKPLPGRRHIVLTRDPTWRSEGAEATDSPIKALAGAASPRISIIGGAEIYALLLPWTTAIELTEVHAEPEGDTILPEFSSDEWREVSREDRPAEGDIPAYSLVRLERA